MTSCREQAFTTQIAAKSERAGTMHCFLPQSAVLQCWHESAFAESFISKARRGRALELLASSKNRHKFTSKFDHHGRDYFIPECIRSIEPRHQHPPDIADILRAMAAPETCHIIGGEHDGQDMELLAAPKQIAGYRTGTVLSCIPAKLAYFEGQTRERFATNDDLFRDIVPMWQT